MSEIKTWEHHLAEMPDGQIITNDDIREAMLREIDALRAALSESSKPKPIAQVIIGKCDCDPHIEYCKFCAPFLFKPTDKGQSGV